MFYTISCMSVYLQFVDQRSPISHFCTRHVSQLAFHIFDGSLPHLLIGDRLAGKMVPIIIEPKRTFAAHSRRGIAVVITVCGYAGYYPNVWSMSLSVLGITSVISSVPSNDSILKLLIVIPSIFLYTMIPLIVDCGYRTAASNG